MSQIVFTGTGRTVGESKIWGALATAFGSPIVLIRSETGNGPADVANRMGVGGSGDVDMQQRAASTPGHP